MASKLVSRTFVDLGVDDKYLFVRKELKISKPPICRGSCLMEFHGSIVENEVGSSLEGIKSMRRWFWFVITLSRELKVLLLSIGSTNETLYFFF